MVNRIIQTLILEVPNIYDHTKMSQELKSAIVDCPRCMGLGSVYVGSYHTDGGEKDSTCPLCNGSRKLQADVIINWKPIIL